MKAHIGVDVASGVVHTLTGTAANEADINQTAALLHGREKAIFGDAGYAGAGKRPELAEREVCWNIAIKRSIIKALPKALRELAEPIERAGLGRTSFHVIKNPGLCRGRLCSGTGSCDTAGWLRTLRSCTPCSPSPTW